jgi:hypothetical protein
MTAYSIAARKERWRRQLSGAYPPEHLFQVWYDPDVPPRPDLWPEKKQERIEWAWELYRQRAQRAEWLADDMVPGLVVSTGTEIFAEAFGCPVMRPEGEMPFARPIITAASQVADLPVPDISAPSLAVLFEIADELRARGGNEVPLGMVDVQSPMDVAALIWDKNEFYIAILEEPEAVKELAHKVYLLLTEFFDEWFRRYGKSHIAHYPDYYMDHGFTLADDEVGIVSSEIFKEFYLPELSALSNRYGGLGMHCCADSQHQWENFKLIPNLRLLNLARPNKILVEAFKFFADFTAQYHCWCGDGPAWTWPSQRPANARIVCEATAENKDEALEISEKFRALEG